VPLMAPMCWQGCLGTCSKAFKGRKKDPTQNVMVVVDFGLKFTYVLAGWEGSTHDALILAAIQRDDGFIVPEGNCTTTSMKLYT